MKTEDEYFRDWEASAFGYGYGTGEEFTLRALTTFMRAIPERAYDYRDLEKACGPEVAWLLINILCNNGDIDYGVSPRFGWLSPGGERVRAYILSHTAEQIADTIHLGEGRHEVCYKDACNCGPQGYEKGRVCPNPFWGRDDPSAHRT